MKTIRQAVFDVLDEYFRELDQAPASEESVFTKAKIDKEVYETHLMYAYRKYQAAEYHLANVARFIKAEHVEMEGLTIPGMDSKDETARPEVTRMVMSTSQTANHYVFELSAFLEALKSSVDFIADVCSYHLPGVPVKGISTLMKLVDKGRSGPIYDEVKDNLEWLKILRDYRHHVVHRRIMCASSGFERYLVQDTTLNVKYPVVIPKSPPPYVPDTRWSRMMEDRQFQFDVTEIRIKKADGKEELLKEYNPAVGYIAIENFMVKHFQQFERFFIQIIECLKTLKFGTYSWQK